MLAAGSRRVSPTMRGMFGPYRSASSRPTRAPVRLKATARFRATVDLPTPPLPLATARTRGSTPDMDRTLRRRWAADVRAAPSCALHGRLADRVLLPDLLLAEA